MSYAERLLLVIACALMSACQQQADEEQSAATVAGSWEPSNLSDPSVQAAARFAATKIGGEGALKALESSSQRPVAGLQYRMHLSLNDGSRWAATVQRKIDDSMELVQSTSIQAVAAPSLRLDPGGLRIFAGDGTERFVPFGATRKEVLRATEFRGSPRESTNGECPPGPLSFASWPDGLNLLFQDDTFAGWSLDGTAGTLETLAGAGIGTTLADLRRAGPVVAEKTTLGHEFVVGGIGGVLDGPSSAARVTALWAGVSCVFR